MKAVAAALVAICWVGCVSTPTRFYVLNPLDSDRRIATQPVGKGVMSIEIASLQLPQYLERPQIVTRTSPSRMELEEFHQWGGNLRKDMMRVLSKNISQLLDTPLVSISPHPPVQGSAGYRVAVEVLKFERDPDAKVRLCARWALSAGKDRKHLTTRMSELESSPVAAGPDLEPTVAAMSGLWGQLSLEIALAIWETAQDEPGP